MLCTQFYCNTPTHQELVWIHISVVESVSFRDYTLPVKIDMSAPGVRHMKTYMYELDQSLSGVVLTLTKNPHEFTHVISFEIMR